MTGLSGLLITIDGEAVDLANVSWIKVAPCGCTPAVTIAYSDYGHPALVVATAKDAAEQFYSTKAEQQRDVDRGFTIRAIKRGDLGDMKCPHDPKWGYERPPCPEGMVWAVGGFGSERTRVKHLVPVESVETDSHEVPYEQWRATSLCRRAAKAHWTTKWHVADGKVECAGCCKKAVA